MLKLKHVISLSLLLALSGFAGKAYAAEKYELTLAHMLSKNHTSCQVVDEWVALVKEKSNGRLIINVFDNSSLVKIEKMFSAIKNGGTDIGMLPPIVSLGETPRLASHGMPFLAENAIKSNLLLEKMLTLPEVQAEVDKVGILLTTGSSDRSCLASINTPILKLEDLKGKRVLAANAPMVEEIKGWGGIPILVSISDLYIALQRGMGEVWYGPIPMVLSAKLNELVKHVTILPSKNDTSPLIMNKESFASLPKDLQDMLLETSAPVGTEISKRAYNQALIDLETLKNSGIKVYELPDAELEKFKTASFDVLKPYWESILKSSGVEDPSGWINTLYKLAEEE